MKFECSDCKKTFHYAARHSHFLTPQDLPVDEDTTVKVADTVETYRCPYCLSLNITEAQPQAIAPEEIESVYIYDLTSGAQTQLDALLAQGYKIVNRYAKAYHLEKPKAKPVQQELGEIIKEGIKEAQAQEELQEQLNGFNHSRGL